MTLGERIVANGRGHSVTNIRTGVTQDKDGWQVVIDFVYSDGSCMREFVCPNGQSAFETPSDADAKAKALAAHFRQILQIERDAERGIGAE